MKTTDFPFDPELVDAVNAVFQRHDTEFSELPKAWKDVPSRRRNKLKGGQVTWKRKRIANRDGARCVYCGCEFFDLYEITLDHVIPYRLIRTWADWALVLSCAPCNSAKNDKIPAVLMPLLSALVYRLAVLNAAAKAGA